MRKTLAFIVSALLVSCAAPTPSTSEELKEINSLLKEYIKNQDKPVQSPPIPSLKPTPASPTPKPSSSPVILTAPASPVVPVSSQTPDPTSTYNPYISTPNQIISYSPTPITTAIPTPLPTLIPTVKPTQAPTPTPLPLPTIAPTPQIPIPANYRLPTGNNKCRTYFGKIIASSSTATFSDWQSPLKFKPGSSVNQYINVFASSLNYPNLGVAIPSLEVGTYLGSNEMFAANPSSTSVLRLAWTESLIESSITHPIGRSEIIIEGNQDGYIWGKINGMVGISINSNTVISGEFSCIP